MRKFYCIYKEKTLLFREVFFCESDVVCEFEEGNFSSIKFNTKIPCLAEIKKETKTKNQEEFKFLLKEYIRSFSCCFPPQKIGVCDSEYNRQFYSRYNVALYKIAYFGRYLIKSYRKALNMLKTPVV